MRRVRYNCAATLDGFIADANGGYDWIVDDASIDFAALFDEFDTFVMGRKTYEVMQAQGEANPLRGKRVVVASRTLRAADHPGVTLVRADLAGHVVALKAEVSGRDIWLFGGGELAGQLIEAGVVDRVEVALMPVLLRCGIPLLPPGPQQRLSLVSATSLASGIQMLVYDVVR